MDVFNVGGDMRRLSPERTRFDMGSDDPFEMSDRERQQKGMQDKSVCLLKPSEGTFAKGNPDGVEHFY